MNFGKLRHAIIFLRPEEVRTNDESESVIGWVPFNPVTKISTEDVYATQDGKICANTEEDWVKKCIVRAYVAPMTGREYSEAQKLREETTYNILTRYFDGITSNMKILYKSSVLDIISVLDTNESHRELKIVCKEKDRNGKEEYYD